MLMVIPIPDLLVLNEPSPRTHTPNEPPAENMHSFVNFLSVCPEPVWVTDCVSMKNIKRTAEDDS